jgi:LysM repeat protein
MTIFRSELMLLVVAALFPAAAAAQMPTTVRPVRQAQDAAAGAQSPGQQPGQQPSQQPSQQPAPRPAAAPAAPVQERAPRPGSVIFTSGNGAPPQSATLAAPAAPAASAAPATHTVAQGETLWALAQQYFGDPLLWPEIYRLNTTTIEDPHWIYPGEELRITATDDTAPTPPSTSQSYLVTPQEDTSGQNAGGARVSPAVGPTIFAPQTARLRAETALGRLAERAYRAVREGEYYSAGFLTENQPLNTGRLLSDVQHSSRQQTSARIAVQLYDDVIVSAPPSDTLQTGSLLLAFRRGDEVGNWGEIIVPTGLLRVKAVQGDKYIAAVLRMFGPLIEGQELLDIQPFSLNPNGHAEVVSEGIAGSVIRARDPHELFQRQQVLFIDKGANDGVRPGDIFQVYQVRTDEEHGGTIEQDQARGIVVSTRNATSTVLIVEIYRGDLGPSSLVRQIGRMPS